MSVIRAKMASLPYTDGSNGNGIKDFVELVRYLRKAPLAFWDQGFIGSYHDLIRRKLSRSRVLEAYGPENSEHAILMYDRLRME